MKATTKFTKEVLFLVALALGLALLAGLSRHGARPAAARPAYQAGTPSPALTQEPPSPVLTEETPILEITKARELNLVFDSDGDGKPDPGDKLRYVISYQNSGQVGAADVSIIDDYDQSLVSVDSAQISTGGEVGDDNITWQVGDLPPGGGGQVTYVVTVKATLDSGSYLLKNAASINSRGVLLMERSVLEEVLVPTPTSTFTSTPQLTPSPTITPTPTQVPPPTTGLGAANLQDPRIFWALTVLTSILELGGIVVLGLVAMKSKLGEAELSRVIRVGFVVTLTVGAVLIMGVFGGIERGAAAGILGTVAGYLLRGIKES